MSSSEEDTWSPVKTDAVVVKPKKKRNIMALEPTEGESHLKGFVSAFATIMDRPLESIVTAAVSTPTSSTSPLKKEKEEKIIVSHDKQPALKSETELAFAQTAERGVVKLFRAVAMSRKRVIDEEASRGIGVTKSGQVRRRRVRALPGAEKPASSATTSMASFLDQLKKSKSAPRSEVSH